MSTVEHFDTRITARPNRGAAIEPVGCRHAMEADLERPMAIAEVASIKAAPPFSSSLPALWRMRRKAT
jgi:hypothetical protein